MRIVDNAMDDALHACFKQWPDPRRNFLVMSVRMLRPWRIQSLAPYRRFQFIVRRDQTAPSSRLL
jgi:hypothetical protein